MLDGNIYAVGGRDSLEKTVKAIECYNVVQNSWSVVREIDDDLYGHLIASF